MNPWTKKINDIDHPRVLSPKIPEMKKRTAFSKTGIK